MSTSSSPPTRARRAGRHQGDASIGRVQHDRKLMDQCQRFAWRLAHVLLDGSARFWWLCCIPAVKGHQWYGYVCTC